MESGHIAPHNRPILHIVVFAAGDAPPATVPDADLYIAADGGADHALGLGITPDLVIGDFDSIDAGALDALRSAGVETITHPATKDAGDLDLAIDEAVRRGATSIVVVGGGGGRLSHLLVNAAIIASPLHAGIERRWITGGAEVTVVTGPGETTVRGAAGDLVTLVAMHGSASGVSIAGAVWELADADLSSGSSLGLSNRIAGSQATVSVKSGTVLVVHERTP